MAGIIWNALRRLARALDNEAIATPQRPGLCRIARLGNNPLGRRTPKPRNCLTCCRPRVGPRRPRLRAAEFAGDGAERQQPDVEAVQLQAGAPGAAREMSVTPKPRPRYGTPCASAVQAAAHCVEPAVRERERAARLAATRPPRSVESAKRIYPTWRYHRTQPAVIVRSPLEEAALGEGWADRPGASED